MTEKRLWIGSNGLYAHFLSFDHFFMHGGDSYVGDLMIMTIFIYWWQKSMLVTFFACWWHSNRSPTSPIRQNVMLVTEIWSWCQTLDSDNVTCHLHPFLRKVIIDSVETSIEFIHIWPPDGFIFYWLYRWVHKMGDTRWPNV